MAMFDIDTSHATDVIPSPEQLARCYNLLHHSYSRHDANIAARVCYGFSDEAMFIVKLLVLLIRQGFIYSFCICPITGTTIYHYIAAVSPVAQ